MTLHPDNIMKYLVQCCRDFTLHLNLILSIFIISQVKFKQRMLFLALRIFFIYFYPSDVKSEGGFLFHVAFSF